jgi:hypothetical protein
MDTKNFVNKWKPIIGIYTQTQWDALTREQQTEISTRRGGAPVIKPDNVDDSIFDEFV